MKRINAINLLSMFIDMFILISSYLISTYIRFDLMYGAETALNIVWSHNYLLGASLYTLVIVVLFYLNNIYTSCYYQSIIDKLSKIIYINTVAIVTLSSILYFAKVIDFSRIAICIFYVISSTFLVSKYYIMRLLSGNYYLQEKHLRHVVIIGNGYLAREYINTVKDVRHRIKIDGYISIPKEDIEYKCLGKYEDIPNILDNPKIEEVVVALEFHEYNFMPSIIEACEKAGTRISIIPSYHKYIPSHPSIEVLDDIKLFNLRDIPLDDIGSAFVKRCFDILFSLLAIILASPLMLIAVIGIKISMPGPIIFKQARLGKNKKIFRMYKFRSMRVNSDSNTAWSTNSDNRRTAFGKFIRKFSIDELPQLFNVLKGDMSLVGPRPEIPHYISKFKKEVPLYMIRNQVKPGMTGWAQVNGLRGDTSIEKRVKYDIYYIENWSLAFDVKILLMTVFGGFINKEKL